MNLKDVIIAVDFDGTVVTHEYPHVGKDIGAVPVLKRMVAEGAKLILWTIRSGEHLQDAVTWFIYQGIPLYGVNENPTQSKWSSSPKVYAQIYIDDAALNAPLIKNELYSRPYIDWTKVEELLFDGK